MLGCQRLTESAAVHGGSRAHQCHPGTLATERQHGRLLVIHRLFRAHRLLLDSPPRVAVQPIRRTGCSHLLPFQLALHLCGDVLCERFAQERPRVLLVVLGAPLGLGHPPHGLVDRAFLLHRCTVEAAARAVVHLHQRRFDALL